MNNIPLLQCFLSRLKDNMEPIFANLNDDLLDATTIFGEDFHKKPSLFEDIEHEAKVAFLKQLKLLDITDNVDLTPREVQCIKFLLKGYSASETAAALDLSKRTVEHYLENIKIKANCSSKVELINKFQILDSLNLLNI